ncbi:MAG: hypothetical protein ACREUW_16565 [Burkholderiales bacterium]
MPTVNISLVREHTEVIRPPRALWVPFMLGRPLGVPGDAAFQRRVVMAALSLFERSAGPVLEDYPEEAPAVVSAEEMEGMACAVDFSSERTDVPLPTLVLEEIAQLRSWYDVALARRGRTALGVAGASPEDLARFLGAWADGTAVPSYRADLPLSNALRLACEELKVFYFEANAGQPGTRSPDSIQRWFWHDTAAGRLFFALKAATERHADRELRHFANENLLPRIARHE